MMLKANQKELTGNSFPETNSLNIRVNLIFTNL